MQHVHSYRPAGEIEDLPVDIVTLPHDLRHLRRKLLHLSNGEMVMLDLKEAVLFADGDRLVLDTGETVEVRAAAEKLFAVHPRDPLHLVELAWHLGNRHLAAEIRGDHIRILRDPVIRTMVEGLGATVEAIEAPFQPVRGAYHSHGSHHHHASDPGHGGERHRDPIGQDDPHRSGA